MEGEVVIEIIFFVPTGNILPYKNFYIVSGNTIFAEAGPKPVTGSD
ncbi:hypothetical protein [Pseudoduganella albidiflava]|nr:hypothetical protein [Pseudoduganella albidiflava]